MSNEPTVAELPDYEAPYKNWYDALSTRMQYADWSVQTGNSDSKVKAQGYLREYMENSPPQCDDLDKIALDEINAINLQNMNEQLDAIHKNRTKYLEIGALLKKISAKVSKA
jgi:hypothetical protein